MSSRFSPKVIEEEFERVVDLKPEVGQVDGVPYRLEVSLDPRRTLVRVDTGIGTATVSDD